MIRRILLLAILAATPVAETRAEFLFSDLGSGTLHAEGAAGTSPAPARSPLPLDSDPETRLDYAAMPAGMDSTSTSSSPGSMPAGALPATLARLPHSNFVTYLVAEVGCRYQEPSLAGPIKPPREAC